MSTYDTIAASLALRAALAAFVFLSFSIYKTINSSDKTGAIYMTRLDDAIPFVPAFSVPYLLFLPYLFFIVGYGILFTPYFAEVAASALAVQIVGAIIYRIHQTHVPRPVVTGSDVFSRLTKFIYRNDNPLCAYPSFHVAYSVLGGYWFAVFFPALAPAVVIVAISIIASTMLIKQHAIIDVIGGITLTTLCLMLVR